MESSHINCSLFLPTPTGFGSYYQGSICAFRFSVFGFFGLCPLLLSLSPWFSPCLVIISSSVSSLPNRPHPLTSCCLHRTIILNDYFKYVNLYLKVHFFFFCIYVLRSQVLSWVLKPLPGVQGALRHYPCCLLQPWTGIPFLAVLFNPPKS